MSSGENRTGTASGTNGRECMRAQEVARRLGISHNLVLRLLREGKLPGFKIGRVWLIRKDQLEQYLDRLMRGVRPDASE